MRPRSRGRHAIRLRRLLLNRSPSQLAENLQVRPPVRSQTPRRTVRSLPARKEPLNRIATALACLVEGVSSGGSSATSLSLCRRAPRVRPLWVISGHSASGVVGPQSVQNQTRVSEGGEGRSLKRRNAHRPHPFVLNTAKFSVGVDGKMSLTCDPSYKTLRKRVIMHGFCVRATRRASTFAGTNGSTRRGHDPRRIRRSPGTNLPRCW